MLDQGVVHEQGHGLQRCLGTKHLARSHAERYKNVSAPPGDDCYVRQRINHSFDGNDNLDLHGFWVHVLSNHIEHLVGEVWHHLKDFLDHLLTLKKLPYYAHHLKFNHQVGAFLKHKLEKDATDAKVCDEHLKALFVTESHCKHAKHISEGHKNFLFGSKLTNILRVFKTKLDYGDHKGNVLLKVHPCENHAVNRIK